MTTTASRDQTFDELAMRRLCRIFGNELGARTFKGTLEAMEREALRSADDLYAFSRILVARGGMEAAVGAMLGVDAVVRGALAARGSH